MKRGDLEREDEVLEAIFPLVRPDGEWVKVIGTAFFISHNGIFATAKHNLTENGETWAGPSGEGLIGLHFVPGNRYYSRPIVEVCTHNTADVAIGLLAPMNHTKTGEYLFNRYLPITLDIQQIDAKATTYAYPRVETAIDEAVSKQSLFYEPKWASGEIVGWLPGGRPFLGPCYQSNLHIESGASGGPVVNENGQVFAINSTGIDPSEEFPIPVSFLSTITDILTLGLKNVEVPGHGRHLPIADLIRLRLIPV